MMHRITISAPRLWAQCVVRLGVLLAGPAGLLGCADSPPQPTAADRALKDPWGYTPKIEKTDTKSGDDAIERGSLKRDLDHVFNP